MVAQEEKLAYPMKLSFELVSIYEVRNVEYP